MSEPIEINIPGFEILEKIGEGGMGSVHKARQLSLDRTVAIKILPKQFSEHRDYVEHFKREAKAEAVLKHPNIVQIYQAGIAEGTYYLVMEHVSGYSLGSLLERKGRLPEEDCLLVAESIAHALDYAWGKARIIHGDIKPDNILIDEDGTVKLSDFLAISLAAGLSKVAPFSDSILGTPNFMSPEQLLGEEALDCRADIYSLGAVLYHLLSGQLPFSGAQEKDMVRYQLTGYLPDLQELTADVSAPVAALVAKMLVRDLEARPQNWKVVLEDLDRVRKSELPMEPLPAPGLSAMKWTLKRGAAAMALKKSSAAAPPHPDSGPPRLPAEPKQTFKKEPPSSRSTWVSLLESLVVLALFVGVLAYYLGRNPSKESLPASPDAAPAENGPGPRLPVAEDNQPPEAAPSLAEPAREAATPELAEEPEFTAPPATPAPSPADVQRGKDLKEYVVFLPTIMGLSKSRNFDEALQRTDAWIGEHPGSRYLDQMQTERSRILSARQILGIIENGKAALRGSPININDKVAGEILDVKDGKLSVRRKLESGVAIHEMDLATLPDADIGRMLRMTDPDQAARDLAIWLISKGSLQRIPELMEELGKAGQMPADLGAWTAEWQQASLNARAYRALDEIQSLVDSGSPEKARARLDEALEYFAASDVFQWAAVDEIIALKQRMTPGSAPTPLPPAAAPEFRSAGESVPAPEEADDGAAEVLSGAESVARLSIPELLEQFVVLDGKVIRLRFQRRGAIEQLSETSFRTTLAEDQYSVPVEFPDDGYKWIRTVPEGWDNRAPRRNVFARVDATQRKLQLLGRLRQAPPGSPAVEYTW